MANEIIIGKEVEKGNLAVDAKYNLISRKHAKIMRKADGIYIEDLNSTNGTYVNGNAVKSKKITSNDTVSLGGPNYYILNLEQALKLLPMSDQEFQSKFLLLKQVYDNYQTESNKIQTKGSEEMMTKRMLPTMLLGSLTGIAMTMYEKNRLEVGIIGGILTVVVFIVATKIASISIKKMRDKLNLLDENYELNYVCPNCMYSLRGRSWRALEKAGKCPICNREFK